MILKIRIKLLNIIFILISFLQYVFILYYIIYNIIFSLYYSEEKFEIKNICAKSISLKQLIIYVKY